MSDPGRKNFGDKIESSVKPDSQKSTTEQFKDKITNTYDNAVGKATNDDNKSYAQQASDALFGNNDGQTAKK